MKRTPVTYKSVVGGGTEYHLQVDAVQLLKMKWDMIIAFPPCTHLAVSGASWFEKKRKDGRQREADFIPVVVWGKAAELVGNSCAKGHRLLVEGRLQIRNFDAKDGTKHWVTEIISQNIEFIERKEQPKQMQDIGEEVPW